MKKKLTILSFFTISILSYFIISCQHVIPCDDLNFHITTTHTDCTGSLSDGTINATASGGTGFEFSLSDTGYQASGSFTGLAAGTYVVRGRNSSGCGATETVVILGAGNPCAGVNINLSETHISPASGQSNGSISVTASPAGTYTYSINSGAFQSSNIFSGLGAGTYIISAKNANGCSSTPLSVTLGSVDPCAGVTISLTETHVTPTSGQTNGSITVTASPAGTYTYSKNGGAFQSSNVFSGLASGTYVIVAKNTNGCTSTPISVTLGSVDPCAGVTISLTETHVTPTTGQTNGSITVVASPAGTYTYNINGGAFQSSNIFSGLGAGTFIISAKNTNGCSGTPISVTLGSVDPCAGVTISVTSTHVSPTTGQSNGSITATATPAGTYTYSINGGAYQASGTFSGLAAGTYTITAKNASGCLGSTSVTLTAVDPCAGVTISVTSTHVSPTTGQSNGSITATANPAGTYTYSINGGAYQVSGTFSNLAAGTYTLSAKNANGCLGSTQVTLIASNPCTGITINISATTVNVLPCPSTAGSITITASGSTGLSYNKNGGAYQTSNIFSGLTAGTYVIGVKDVNGCTNTQSVTVGTAAMGTNFTNVRTIIHAKCGSCHLNGGNTAGYNFDNDCSIVTYWNQIKGTCVQPYSRPQMPPSAPLTSTQQSQITAWINAGHGYTN